MMPRKAANKKRVTERVSDIQIGNDSVKETFKIEQKYKLSGVHDSFVELLSQKHVNMCFLDGPAGTAKTYCAALAGLQLLSQGRIEQILYIRSLVESAEQKMGFLPGDEKEKFNPWIEPLLDKLHELVRAQDVNSLLKNDQVIAKPVNLLRGLTFKNSFIIIDEAQNMTEGELITILTRFGYGSRYCIIGDMKQADIKGKSGFKKVFDKFDTDQAEDNGIYTFTMTSSEIVRSPILSFIVDTLTSS